MSTFHLQIVTPDGGFFDGEAEKLIVRAIDGDVCILARHSPYVTALGTGEARVTIDGKRRRAACAGGMLAVTKDNVPPLRGPRRATRPAPTERRSARISGWKRRRRSASWNWHRRA